MILSNHDIANCLDKGFLKIAPFDPEQLRGASYTLTLGSVAFKLAPKEYIDTRNVKQEHQEFEITAEGYTLQPGEFIIGTSAETITLDDRLAGMLSTRGSAAQIGLDVILSSTFMEPRSNGPMALEIKNNSNIPIKLFPGIPIVKAIFFLLHTKAEKKEGSNFFKRRES